LGVPAVSMSPEQAAEHFKAFPFIALDVPMPNASTKQLLNWQPSHPTRLADLDQE
jgi:hypothetical protein